MERAKTLDRYKMKDEQKTLNRDGRKEQQTLTRAKEAPVWTNCPKQERTTNEYGNKGKSHSYSVAQYQKTIDKGAFTHHKRKRSSKEP